MRDSNTTVKSFDMSSVPVNTKPIRKYKIEFALPGHDISPMEVTELTGLQDVYKHLDKNVKSSFFRSILFRGYSLKILITSEVANDSRN